MRISKAIAKLGLGNRIMPNTASKIKQRELEANYKAAHYAGYSYAQVIVKRNGDTLYFASNEPLNIENEADKQISDWDRATNG